MFSVCSTEAAGLTTAAPRLLRGVGVSLLVLDLSVGRSLRKMTSVQRQRTRSSTYRQLETEAEGDEEAGESPPSPSTREMPEAPELPTWLPDREVQEVDAPAWFENDWYACQVGQRCWHR